VTLSKIKERVNVLGQFIAVATACVHDAIYLSEV
jgi:hypothetical protein